MSDWYKLETNLVINQLKSSAETGLSLPTVNKLQTQFGKNELEESGIRPPWKILWEQLTATMVLILLGAALVSALLGEYKDAVAIGAIVILFAILGFIQEYRAEQAMAALKRMATPLVRVMRDNKLREITSTELVPGDIIFLEAGNLLPADVRILESASLRIQEAMLTGESEPIEKDSRPRSGVDLPLGDRYNMGYMGTMVTYGRGKGIVVETGMRTELGKIASMLQSVSQEITPLQHRLDQLGKLLAIIGVSIAMIIFISGILVGEPLRDMLLTSVSIAVAIIPEGLPAVVTITLALGAQRMLKRQALIRKLPAVETLGSVTVICSDKTGTLTENRMTVVILDVAGHQISLDENMVRRMPSLSQPDSGDEFTSPKTLPQSIPLLLAGGALCNDATLNISEDGTRFQTIGDPTEGALLIAAAHLGLQPGQLLSTLPRIEEIPFDSERKRMTTVHQFNGQTSAEISSLLGLEDQTSNWFSFTKGAVDSLLDISTQVWVEGKAQPLYNKWHERILSANDNLAQKGMRVLGIGFRSLLERPEKNDLHQLEGELTIIGIIGMIDPPRPEVKVAVQTCIDAGIRPVMITGDHPLTARQIAFELGILPAQTDTQKELLTGQELNKISDDELSGLVESISVYARVSPEHKLKIVQALQNKGQIVAMTGDGVNDAPALKQANIGVAMGITGTDVSKEAAEMVLQDDNFASIVAAVEEGRTIYDNLRKFIKFSVAGNIGKVSVMLLAPLLGKPIPLEPLQLLWLNLLTDGLLGLSLGLEPPEKDVMQRPPYSPKQGIFSGGLGQHVLWVGSLIGILALGVGYFFWKANPDGNWQSIVFATLGFSQWFQALATRSRYDSTFQLGIRSNPAGALIALLVFGLQIAVLYTPAMQNFFRTESLSMVELGLSLLLSSLVFWAIEIEKWLARR
jgi:Ca2+-transporting ATPase